jgi:hypothetical protein
VEYSMNLFSCCVIQPGYLSALAPSLCSSAGMVEELRIGGHWFKSWARLIFFTWIDHSHCDKIHSSLTAVHYFDDVYVEMQPVAWK